MKKHWKKVLSLGLSLLMLAGQPFCVSFKNSGFPGISYGAERTALVSATSLNVRSAPGTANTVVGKLSYGAPVTVLSEAAATDGSLWYQIRFTGTAGEAATGYVQGSYITFSSASNTSNTDFEAYLNGQGFPESYRPALRELHARYPQWVFTAFDTGLDWNEVIQNESLVGRNLVASSSPSSWKSTAPGAYDWTTGTWPGFDGSSWVAASEDIIRYYMDPRNFLNETYIFQFLLQDYDASIHTREGLSSMVKGTFLEGNGSVGGAYQGTGTALGGQTSGTGNTGNGQTSGTGNTGNGQTLGTGNTGQTDTGVSTGTGPQDSSLGTGSSENNPSGIKGSGNNYGPGYSQGTAGNSGTQNQTSSGTTSSGTNGSGAFSDVWLGVSPGANLSQNKDRLSVSRHQTDQVTDSVALVGPGENTGTNGNGVSGEPAASGTNGGAQQSGTPGTPPASQTAPAATVPGNDSGSGTVGPGGSGSSAAEPGQTTQTSLGNTGFTGTSAPYVDILLEAGAQSGVSPYVLTAMILQEQGRDGKSDSISGKSGYYNFYNFEAYASNGMTAVQRGLWYASQAGNYLRPWNSADKSIIGGALQYGQNYMKAGQNTFYLKKFNVQGTNLYKHQYMTNVEGAAAEGAKMAEAYNETMRKTVMRFSIPVYRNMPENACAKPDGGGSPNNKLQSLTINGYNLSPAFSPDTLTYDVNVGNNESSIILYAAAADSTSVVAGTGTIALNTAVTEVKVTVTAQNGAVREYRLRITKQNGVSAGGNGGSGVIAPGSGMTGTDNSGNTAAGTGTPGTDITGTGVTGGSTQAPSAGPGTPPATGTTSSGTVHTGPGGSNVTIVP